MPVGDARRIATSLVSSSARPHGQPTLFRAAFFCAHREWRYTHVMQLARGSWLVIGIVGGAIVVGIVALIIRPKPISQYLPAATQMTQTTQPLDQSAP